MYGFGYNENEFWTSVDHPLGDLIIEMGNELDPDGNTFHRDIARRANELLTKTDWDKLNKLETQTKEEKAISSGLLSDDEFRKQALFKAGQLAIAAQAILGAQATQFGDAVSQLDKVLKDYNNFIFDRVNQKV